MKPYEMVVLYHPDLEIDLDKPLSKVEKIIKDQKGKVAKTDVWGKRKLAYPINKQDFAVYVYYDVELPPEAVSGIEQALNITDEVIRYIITHPVPVFEEDKEAEETKEEETEEVKKPAKKTKSTTAKAKQDKE